MAVVSHFITLCSKLFAELDVLGWFYDISQSNYIVGLTLHI